MRVTTPREHPRALEPDVRPRDGPHGHIRPIRPDDAPRLQELYDRLSRDTAYQRFFTVMKCLPPDWARMLASVDYQRRLALIVEHDGTRGVELIGVGRYEPTDEPDTVEVAFVVQDGWQSRRLGTNLFRELPHPAAAPGGRRFRAYVLSDNRRMLGLITSLADVREGKTVQGGRELRFTRRAEPTPATR